MTVIVDAHHHIWRQQDLPWLVGPMQPRIFGAYDHSESDLRVDLHDKAVDELRRAFEEYELYRDYYRRRGDNPKEAMPQHEFAARLARQEAAQ